MSVAIALASALLVVGMTFTARSRRAERREALLLADPVEAVDPSESAATGSLAGLVLAALVGLLVVYHLAIPSAMGELRNRLTALALAAAALACAIHLLTDVQNRWNTAPDSGRGNLMSAALLGLGLFTLAVCLLGTLPLSRDPHGFARRVQLACVIALGVMAAFWNWLAGVWVQQLDQGRAWTTAGHLIPAARGMSRGVLVTAVLLAIRTLTGVPPLPGEG